MTDKCKYCPYYQWDKQSQEYECTYNHVAHFLDKSHACKKAIKNMIKAGKNYERYERNKV